VPVQLHRRPQQQQAEEEKHEGEQRQQCRTQSDEDSAQHEGGDNAEGQYTLLMLTPARATQ
jgi:hypothetical protein